VTSTTLQRQPFFNGVFVAACAAARCFEDPKILKDTRMLAWVLMPDHAHWLLQLGECEELADVVNRLKSASAREANLALARKGALWAPAFHDRALRSEDDIPDAARYIVANPLRAGLVTKLGNYPYWNAIWL
jgi:REP element-mobilizing transposase RayT